MTLRLRFLRNQTPLKKECKCCGKIHNEIPEYARLHLDDVLGGYYWECFCGSTLYVRDPEMVEPAKEEKAV